MKTTQFLPFGVGFDRLCGLFRTHVNLIVRDTRAANQISYTTGDGEQPHVEADRRFIEVDISRQNKKMSEY